MASCTMTRAAMTPCASARPVPPATTRMSASTLPHRLLARRPARPSGIPSSSSLPGQKRRLSATAQSGATDAATTESAREAPPPGLLMAATGGALAALQAGLPGLAMADALEESAGEGSSLFVTIGFTIAIAALVIVTGGVLYLSGMQFLDKRQELEDQEALEKTETASAASSKSDKKKKKKKSTRVRERVAARNGKGFSKKERSNTEQD